MVPVKSFKDKLLSFQKDQVMIICYVNIQHDRNCKEKVLLFNSSKKPRCVKDVKHLPVNFEHALLKISQ